MDFYGRRAFHLRLGRVLALFALLFWSAAMVRAASLPVFEPLFLQVTNDIAFILENFDGSVPQKRTLALLTRARTAMLNDQLLDEQALASVVDLLDGNTNYTAALDQSAINARETVLGRYDALALHVADLPPSIRANRVREHFQNLANDHAALAGAQHAAGISSLLAPFGRRMKTTARLVTRAQIMPRPRVSQNGVRAVVDGHRFNSSGNGPHSPNLFEVTAPGGLYYTSLCRAVDETKVIYLTLPIITDQVRYEVADGLASVTYTPDIFATNIVTLAATNGTFFVQSDQKEIFGFFSCTGPGFQVKDGRFRIEIPRGLRGK